MYYYYTMIFLVVIEIFFDLNCTAQRRGRLIRGSAYKRVYKVYFFRGLYYRSL